MTISTQLPGYVNDTYLRSLVFKEGKGTGKEGDRCSIQEYRAWFDLDPASDAIPEGDSKVVGRYIIGFQDRLIGAGATPVQVYELVGRHLPKLRGSYGSAKLEERRSFLLADLMVRELAPIWFEAHPDLVQYAEQLRALAPITDRLSNETAYKVYDAARAAGWTARRKSFDGLEARIKEALSRAKPEGLSDRVWKRTEVAAEVAATAVAVAVAVAAAAATAVATAAAAATAVATAVAVAEVAVAAAAAVAVAAEAAEAEAGPGESKAAFEERVYWDVRAAVRGAIYGKTKELLLAQQRERIERSWAVGGRFIEQALAMTEAGA